MSKKLTKEEVQKRLNESFYYPVTLLSKYINKRSNITLQCSNCDYIWSTRAQNLLYRNKNIIHHCPNCEKSNLSSKIEMSCAYCGKIIYRYQNDIDRNKSGFFYCSKTCGNLHKNQIRRENGEWDKSLNYRQKALEIFPHACYCCGYNEDERILEVHHIDGEHSNNNINNLIILCPTCHRKITLKYYSLDLEHHCLIQL